MPNLFVNSFREKNRFFLTGSLVIEQMTTLTLMCHVSAVQTWMVLFLCVFLLLFFLAGQATSQQRDSRNVSGVRGTGVGRVFKNNPICGSTVG